MVFLFRILSKCKARQSRNSSRNRGYIEESVTAHKMVDVTYKTSLGSSKPQQQSTMESASHRSVFYHGIHRWNIHSASATLQSYPRISFAAIRLF